METPNSGEVARSHHHLDSVAGWGVSLTLHLLLLLTFASVTWVTGSILRHPEPEETEAGVLMEEETSPIAPGDPAPIEIGGTKDVLQLPRFQSATTVQKIPTLTTGSKTSGETELLIGLDMGASGGASAMKGSWGDLAGGGALGGGGGGNWNSMVRSLRRRGLDIVLTFDSTGSMSGEISAVKAQIEDIGVKLKKLIPKVRIGICTYRDEGDDYVVRGLPLTGNIQKVQMFLNGVTAGGGGDRPEAVHKALKWSVANNEFRQSARKVIILFGDAPPHKDDIRACIRTAAAFRLQQRGIVSTVTCGRGGVKVYGGKLSSFVRIAQAGSGEAFFSTDQRKIMEQLIVLVFGGKHRAKVNEVFK